MGIDVCIDYSIRSMAHPEESQQAVRVRGGQGAADDRLAAAQAAALHAAAQLLRRLLRLLLTRQRLLLLQPHQLRLRSPNILVIHHSMAGAAAASLMHSPAEHRRLDQQTMECLGPGRPSAEAADCDCRLPASPEAARLRLIAALAPLRSAQDMRSWDGPVKSAPAALAAAAGRP